MHSARKLVFLTLTWFLSFTAAAALSSAAYHRVYSSQENTPFERSPFSSKATPSGHTSRNSIANPNSVAPVEDKQRSIHGEVRSEAFWTAASLGEAHGILRLATTTSVESSRFLDFLLPAFKQETGIRVDVIASGTGAALSLGKRGDVDALLVHAPDLEKRFMEEGHGVVRTTFMYNDFLLVGPLDDPAGVRTALTIQACFNRIAHARTLFLSRGDSSGTHMKEREIWDKARILPEGFWYREVGQGMETLLRMTSELQAYTLTDLATWIFLKKKLTLKELYRNRNEPLLKNSYSIILVNPHRHPNVSFPEARSFLEWITSPKGLERIQAYTLGGEQVFFPERQP